MFTICPKCSLKLVVTAADLRVAQGYVRCGRCSNIFNALVGLSDEQQAVLAREQQGEAASRAPDSAPPARTPRPVSPEPRLPLTTSSASTAPSAAPPEPPAPQPPEPAPPQQTQTREIAPETSADELLSDAALEFDAETTDVSEVFVEPALDDTGSTGQSESIILRTEDALPEELELDEESAEEPESAEKSPETLEESESLPGAWRAGRDGRAGTAQLEPAAKSLEMTDEFELADLESLLETDAARDGTADRAAADDNAPAQRMENRGLAETSSTADADSNTDADGIADADVNTDENRDKHADATRTVSPVAMHEALDGLAAASAPVRRRSWLFVAGSAALVLLLAAQIVHHYRARLAEVAWLRRPLTGVYAAFGMPLVPHWNVRAYEVRQLGAIVDPGNPGTLTVRASIENTAPREQPLPLLRVTVQDRFGNRVAARDVPPAAYLPKASANRKYLGAGERVDAEIALVDPGPRVVGFELDACLEDAAERVSCAHQPRSLR
ncbi:MAG: zinc-ribbon and DUF3426 domain-containing protein [Steroidobacteraceae bacterium]